jgi:hypothetical protein
VNINKDALSIGAEKERAHGLSRELAKEPGRRSDTIVSVSTGFDNRPASELAEEIRVRISIPELWRRLGLPGEPKQSCRSPFREEKNASFSISRCGKKFYDHGNRDYRGDVFDFYGFAVNCDRKQAFKDLLDMVGGANVSVTPVARIAKVAALEPERKQFHPELQKLDKNDLRTIHHSRAIALEGLEIAAERGLLWKAVLQNHPAWILTDRTNNSYLARRLDGECWNHLPSKPKAYLTPGSRGAWPIGIKEANNFPAIALTEGGPDFLSAFAMAWADDVDHLVAPVCMACATKTIAEDALEGFRGKRVRIFVHDDDAGHSAASDWLHQLKGIASKVDGYRFDGLIKTDGSKVEDLNDLCRIDHDCWEQNVQIVDSVMDFAKEGRN